MIGPCLLILEDDETRVARFTTAIEQIDKSVKVEIWRSAVRMVEEVEPHLGTACLISLDHDLESPLGQTVDPGDGLDVSGK